MTFRFFHEFIDYNAYIGIIIFQLAMHYIRHFRNDLSGNHWSVSYQTDRNIFFQNIIADCLDQNIGVNKVFIAHLLHSDQNDTRPKPH